MRSNRQALPADRIGIQQLHLGQQTFDITAKTAERLPQQISRRVQSSLIALQGRLQLWCKASPGCPHLVMRPKPAVGQQLHEL
ncbi:hypothetical protein MNNICLKF_00107 [Synechococcus sp. CBW1107]|jgi:hypothetical protein|nr:hypothetical protein MNNICLKF_00107 [Synechococcus sp. CBW1107]